MNKLTAHTFRRLSAGTAYCLSLLLPFTCDATTEQQWRFRVYLDDREIGHHHFTLSRSGTLQRLVSEAKFDVTFLKIPFYSYRHDSAEHWNNECLERIWSNTYQNGKAYRLEGMASDGGFRITSDSEEYTLPHCISTFAYWDKSLLERGSLLNSQSGEYLDVEFKYVGANNLARGISAIQAHHYRLSAKSLDIDLWYSHDDQWLALESTTGNGSRLRYVSE